MDKNCQFWERSKITQIFFLRFLAVFSGKNFVEIDYTILNFSTIQTSQSFLNFLSFSKPPYHKTPYFIDVLQNKGFKKQLHKVFSIFYYLWYIESPTIKKSLNFQNVSEKMQITQKKNLRFLRKSLKFFLCGFFDSSKKSNFS